MQTRRRNGGGGIEAGGGKGEKKIAIFYSQSVFTVQRTKRERK